MLRWELQREFKAIQDKSAKPSKLSGIRLPVSSAGTNWWKKVMTNFNKGLRISNI